MRRAFVATVASAAALVAIVGAQAKAPPGGIDVCGVSGCTHVAGGPDAEQLYIGSLQDLRRAEAPAPFFVLHLQWSETQKQTAYWLPLQNRVRWGGGFSAWTQPDARAETILRQATNGIESFRMQPTRITVGGRPVQAPQTYLRLFRRGRWTAEGPLNAVWTRLRITSAVESPWSDDAATILLDRKTPFVFIDGAFLKVPPAVAQQARQRLPIR
jgi:hypothetical protein